MNSKNSIHRILILSGLFLILIVAVAGIIYNRNPPNDPPCRTSTPQYFCGTNNLPENLKKGRQAFNQMCVACHKLNARATGPALQQVDSIIYWKWVMQKEIKIDTTKFEVPGIDYHNHLSKKLTDDELHAIFDYLSYVEE